MKTLEIIFFFSKKNNQCIMYLQGTTYKRLNVSLNIFVLQKIRPPSPLESGLVFKKGHHPMKIERWYT